MRLRELYQAWKKSGKFTGEVVGVVQRFSEGKNNFVSQPVEVVTGRYDDGKQITRSAYLGLFDVTLRNEKGEVKTFNGGVCVTPEMGERRTYNLSREVTSDERNRRALANFRSSN